MAMKIVRFNCCGMDVHKNLVVATIGITDRKTNVTEYFQRSFSTLNSDLYRLKDWLQSHHCSDVCMESTGKYWIPIFNVLEDEINVFCSAPYDGFAPGESGSPALRPSGIAPVAFPYTTFDVIVRIDVVEIGRASCRERV